MFMQNQIPLLKGLSNRVALPLPYYLRHLFFASALGILFLLKPSLGFSEVLFILATTALYPYSRLAYDTLVSFFMGGTGIFMPIHIAGFLELLAIVFLWSLSIIIGPVVMILLLVIRRFFQPHEVQ